MNAPLASIDSPLAESRRLASLRALDLLDSPPDAEFDALVALGSKLLDCPTALFNLIDRDRQWVKAISAGDPAAHSCPRAETFCNSTIRGDSLLVVEDAKCDARFRHLPMVERGDVRFYAGMPIHVLDSQGERRAIGAVCIVDEKPRTLDATQRAALQQLATLAEALVAARIVARRATATARLAERQSNVLRRKDHIFRQAERMTAIGSWRLDLTDETLDWSEGVFRIHDLPVGATPSVERALEFYPPHDRARVTAALAASIETGEPFSVELDFVSDSGRQRRVRSMGEAEMVDGRPVGVVGVFQDITERYALELALRTSAERDDLTGIANRSAFNRRLQEAMTAARASGEPLVLALLDLDGFKVVNDTLGHLAGDDVLKAVGKRLEQPWLRGSFAARLGGDEFAVIVSDPMLARDRNFAMRLEDELRVPVTANGLTIANAGTVGAVALSADIGSPREFVHRADTMLYAAKRERIGERRQGMRAGRCRDQTNTPG